MTDVAMTTPTYDEKAKPRRVPKGLLPSSWVGQSVRIDYESPEGAATASGVLADVFGAGPCIKTGYGGRTLISWDRLVLVELVGN